jgi:hypothetical protein
MAIHPENSDIYTLGFKRGTVANARLSLLLAFEGELAKNSTLKILIPDQSFEFRVPSNVGKYEDYEYSFDIDVAQEQLISALKSGKEIEVQVVTNDKKINSKLSLAGVVASMLFIDEVQGRVGRLDALQAKGGKPAADVVTRVSELDSKTQLPESVSLAWNNSFNECDEQEDDVISKYGGLRIDLDEDGSLFLLPCGTPGAYNAPYIAILLDNQNNKTRDISFPILGASGPTTMDTAYNVNWNDKKSQLDAFFKGRGIGDCGSKQLWQWDGDGIFGTFELVEERVKDDCDEKFGDFPLIWPPD